MSIPFTLREAIDKAIPEIEKGTDSYGKAAKRIGVGKATVYRRHITLLTAQVTGLKDRRDKTQTEVKGLEKTYGDLEPRYRKKHEDLEAKYQEKKSRLEGSYQKLEANLKGQIEKLNQEQAEIKSVFEAEGLGWNEGIQLLRNVRNLRDELNSLQAKIAKYTTELSNWEKEAKRSRSTILQLRDQLSDLRECVEREEVAFDVLLGEISSARDQLYAIREEERRLAERAKNFRGIIVTGKLGKRKASLQAEIISLAEETRRLKASVEFLTGKIKDLKAEREILQSGKEEDIKKFNEIAERIVTEAKQESEQILAAAEEERKRTLAEGSVARKELNAALKKKTEFLKEELQQLNIDVKREERRKAEIEEECERRVEEAHEQAKLIVEGAELKREKILKEAEELIDRLKEKSTLEAEEPEMKLPRMAPKEEILTKLASMEKSLDKIEERRREKRRKTP